MSSAFAPLALLLVLMGGGSFQRIGRLDHPAIRECSGIVASRRHSGIFWVHNDSGNPPELFAVRRDGSLVRTFTVDVPNVDWEDIALDDQGHLFLGDIGNNKERLPLRAIYRLDEPDPAVEPEGPLHVSLASFYRFPRGGRFDAESLFIDGGQAVLISKRLDGQPAELFKVTLDPPSSLLFPKLPVPIGELPGFLEPATGADLSADGKSLAVCSLKVARVYGRDADGGGGGGWKLRNEVRYEADQIEAIAWDGPDLILAGEGRGLYRITLPKARR